MLTDHNKAWKIQISCPPPHHVKTEKWMALQGFLFNRIGGEERGMETVKVMEVIFRVLPGCVWCVVWPQAVNLLGYSLCICIKVATMLALLLHRKIYSGGFLLSLILKDIESKSFYYVVRDFLPISAQHSPPSNYHKHSPSVSNKLWLSAEDRFPTSQKIKK